MYRSILRIALPNILGNLSVPLLGAVDMALMGRLEDPANIGAIALGGVLFAYLYWGFAFLRMGSTGFTAQAFGENNFQKCGDILGRALVIAILGGAFLMMLQVPIAQLGFGLIDGGHEVELLAREYYSIRLFGAPAVLGLFALSGWFLGMQNANFPMFLVLCVNVINVILDVVFVQYFHWGVRGVALGTVLANYSGFLLGLILLFARYRSILGYWRWKNILNIVEMTNFLRVNRDIFIRTLMIIFVFTYVQSKPAEIGEVELAVNAILVQMVLMYSFFLDGVAYAAEALVGKYIGAIDAKGLKEAIKKIFILGAGVSFSFSLFFLFAGQEVVRLMTNIPEVLAFSAPYLIWTALIPLASFAGFIWDGIYIGATASKYMLWSVSLSTGIVFVPIYFLSREALGLHGLWMAFALFFVSRSLFQTFWARRAILKLVQ